MKEVLMPDEYIPDYSKSEVEQMKDIEKHNKEVDKALKELEKMGK